jgi:class 3 adenylate cyclase
VRPVSSTKLVERLGDAVAADLLARTRPHSRATCDAHATAARSTRAMAFCCFFDRPIEAVRFALDLSGALRELGAGESTRSCLARGHPCGEVVLRENGARTWRAAPKPIEVEGLAKALRHA